MPSEELAEASSNWRQRPTAHALLHAALQLARQQVAHEMLEAELSDVDREGVAALAAREEELARAAKAANASLAADVYDEAV